MDKNKIITELSSSPIKQIDELPVITKDMILPFDKLAWEDFEKFCFQLGIKNMECLETSYLYGRSGQKQDGIDIYFKDRGENKLWQIKRYKQFKKNDVTNAVGEFIKGKWVDKAKEFVLCVSNYLDDVEIVDEIDKQSDILKNKGIIFSVLNSQKLSIMARKYPDLVEIFFGKHWLDALGISKNKDNGFEPKSYWQTDTGKVINSQQIYQHGDFKFKINDTDTTIYVDEQLPDGNDTHILFNTESGAVTVEKYPYPLEEYNIDVPQSIIVRVEEGVTIINGKEYQVKQYHLKWGKRAIFLYDNGKLVDVDINTRTFIDHTNKIIHVFDIAKDAIDL